MTIFQALILGIVQGITEFLPVSSSGHLVIFPALFAWNESPFLFDILLHFGTALALIAYFWKDLAAIPQALFEDAHQKNLRWKDLSDDSRMGVYLFVGILPAGLFGFFFDDVIEATFRSVTSVTLFLVLGSVLMYGAEKARDRVEEPDLKKSFFIGLFQVLALLPGMSRSASTISGGMLLGLSREKAAKFSFLLAVPITLAAAFYGVFKDPVAVKHIFSVPLVVGFITSFVVGILSIKLLLKFLRSHTLFPFILYRIVLSLVLLSIFA